MNDSLQTTHYKWLTNSYERFITTNLLLMNVTELANQPHVKVLQNCLFFKYYKYFSQILIHSTWSHFGWQISVHWKGLSPTCHVTCICRDESTRTRTGSGAAEGTAKQNKRYRDFKHYSITVYNVFATYFSSCVQHWFKSIVILPMSHLARNLVPWRPTLSCQLYIFCY